MSLADIANVQISASTVTPSRASFGVPLVLAAHSVPGPLVQAFRSLSEAEEAGFTAEDYPVLHGIVAALFSQDPRPEVVKIGRRSSSWTQSLRFTPTITTEGFTYKLTVAGEPITYTVPAEATVESICTALEALLDAAGFVATASATHVDAVAPAPGVFLTVTDRSRELEVEDRTSGAETGLAEDLSACETEDSDFYGVLVDVSTKAAILEVAAWAEARRVLFVARTHDTATTKAAVTDDVLSTLKASSYARTIPFYHPDVGGFIDAGILGSRLTADPGSDTWAYKRIAGVASYKLTGTEEAAIKAKNGNIYTVIAGIPLTRWGVSSAGEYADTVRGIDWFQARLQERIVFVVANNPKIPYTDAGVDVLRGEVYAQLEDAQSVGFIATDPAPVVTAQKVANVNPIDRAARTYSGLEFSAQLAGAIHKITIRGTLRV